MSDLKNRENAELAPLRRKLAEIDDKIAARERELGIEKTHIDQFHDPKLGGLKNQRYGIHDRMNEVMAKYRELSFAPSK